MPSSKALGAPLSQENYLLDTAVSKMCTLTLFSLNMHMLSVLKSVDQCKKAEIFIRKAPAGAGGAPVSMRPYLAESRLLASPDKSCQRLEESACLLKNEGHRAAGVTSGLAR